MTRAIEAPGHIGDDADAPRPEPLSELCRAIRAPVDHAGLDASA